MTVFDPEIAAQAILPKEIGAKSMSLHLAIHLHPEMVQAMVFDYESQQILWLKKFDLDDTYDRTLARAVDFVNLKNWGDFVFRKTSISFDYPDFTLVPTGFLEDGKQSDLLKFSVGREPDNVEVYEVNEVGAAVLYDLPVIVQRLAERFPNARFFPSVGFFLKDTLRSANGLHVLVQEGFMLAVVFHEGDMRLTNHYGIQNNEDVLYHLSNAAMRLNIHLASAKVVLYGSDAGEGLKSLLEDYIETVEVWTSEVVKEPNAHLYYSSFIHSQCV